MGTRSRCRRERALRTSVRRLPQAVANLIQRRLLGGAHLLPFLLVGGRDGRREGHDELAVVIELLGCALPADGGGRFGDPLEASVVQLAGRVVTVPVEL